MGLAETGRAEHARCDSSALARFALVLLLSLPTQPAHIPRRTLVAEAEAAAAAAATNHSGRRRRRRLPRLAMGLAETGRAEHARCDSRALARYEPRARATLPTPPSWKGPERVNKDLVAGRQPLRHSGRRRRRLPRLAMAFFSLCGRSRRTVISAC